MKYRSLIFISIISVFIAQAVHAIPAQLLGNTGAEKQIVDKGAAEHYYQVGLKHLTEGNLEMAKKSYLISLKNLPDFIKPMLGLAEVAYKENNLKEAGSWINYAYEKAPFNTYVLSSHGRLLYQQGDYKGAEKDFLKALEINPRIVGTNMDLGDLYYSALKQPENAVIAYKKVIKLEPGHAGAHYALGMSFYALKKLNEAEHELLAASKLSPTNPLPYFALGNVAVSKNKLDKALAYFDKVISLDATNIKSLSRRGDIYSVLDNDEMAARDYEAVLAINAKQTDVNMKLGMLHQKHGRYEKAKTAYMNVIETAPDAVLAYNNLAWMAAENNSDLDSAVKWANKATQLAPKSSAVFDTLGWVYHVQKNHKSATSAFKKATQLNPENTTAFYHLGLSYMAQKDKAKAKDALNKAIQLDAGSADAKLAKESLKKLK